MKFLRRAFLLAVVTAVMAAALIYGLVAVCIYGPSQRLGDLVVMSAGEASFTRTLLPLWISSAQLQQITARNAVQDTDAVTDTSLVTAGQAGSTPADSTSSPYLVTTSYDDGIEVRDGMELHTISGTTWSGIMLLVKDPSRVFVGTSQDAYSSDTPGLSLPAIAQRFDAQAAVNGAFFEDDGGVGNGGMPLGFVFSGGKQLAGGSDTPYLLIGFDADNVLICGTMTGAEAQTRGIRDALSCKPFLIVNGEPADLTGSGSGLNPRTAIGQRADGAVCLLVIDGRQTHSLGASLADLEDVMLAFGAVNAGNLDGGGSTALYYDGEVLNHVSSVYGMRPIPDAICIKRQG